MLLAFVFLAQKLWSYRENVEVDLSAWDTCCLGVCCLAYMGTVYMCPVMYRTLLYVTTHKKLSYVKVAKTYCKSNMLKYLPGNVMQYVGRNQIAIDEELSHSEVALATLIEIGIVVSSAVVVAVLFSYSYAVEWIERFVHVNFWIVGVLIVVAVLICVIILIRFRDRIMNYLKGILTKANVMKILGLIIYHSIILILNGIIYFGVLSVLDINMDSEYYFVGIGLYALSFVLGYVTPGVPGGIGIREAVLVYFFSAFMLEAQVLTGALVVRIISILGDILCWAIITITTNKGLIGVKRK